MHLLYVSSATSLLEDPDLEHLLMQSRNRNKKQNVTGMLLYLHGSFIQVLEGEEKDVEDIYADIIRDVRNSGNIVLIRESITNRDFPNWSMGFKRLSEKDKTELPGYTNFLTQTIEPSQLAKMPMTVKLLYQFKETNA